MEPTTLQIIAKDFAWLLLQVTIVAVVYLAVSKLTAGRRSSAPGLQKSSHGQTRVVREQGSSLSSS